MKFQNPADFAAMIEETFNPEIEDNGLFYRRVATELGRHSLTTKERDEAFRAREFAILVFQRTGRPFDICHKSPVSNAAWWITQLDLACQQNKGVH